MAPRKKARDGYNEHRSLSEEGYELIRQRILRGDYPLGAILSRRKLAAEFRMSFLPITQALLKLEDDGLVERKPRVGTRVRIPSAEDIRGHYVVREGLETQAVRLFSEKASLRQREELRRMGTRIDALYDRVATGNHSREFIYRVHHYHMRFHMRIVESTGCTALCQAIEKNQVLVFNWLYDMAAELVTLPLRFHFELARAVAGHNPEKAELAVREHIRHGLDYILRRMDQHTFSGLWRLRRTES